MLHLQLKIAVFLLTLLFSNAYSADFRKHIYVNNPPKHVRLSPSYTDSVHVKYFGAGGFLIRYKAAGLMFAPFFSNQSLWRLALTNIKVDTTTITTHLDPLKLDDIESILVGHAHYDHLMDIPYIYRKYFSAKKPFTIYGSQTMKNLIVDTKNNKTEVPDANLFALTNQYVTTKSQVGQPVIVHSSNRIRIHAITSMHASHVLGIEFFQGHRDTPVADPPTSAFDWIKGQTLAYLIDFLDDQKKPIFRIHYQDSASDSYVSMPNNALLKDGKLVDLSILCVASFTNVDKYPQDLLKRLKPKYAILAHWEDFFTDYSHNLDTLTVKPVLFTNPTRFIKIVKNLPNPRPKWRLPLPGSWMFYPVQQP